MSAQQSESIDKAVQAHLYMDKIEKLFRLAHETKEERLKGLIVEKLKSILMDQQALLEQITNDGRMKERDYLLNSKSLMNIFKNIESFIK